MEMDNLKKIDNTVCENSVKDQLKSYSSCSILETNSGFSLNSNPDTQSDSYSNFDSDSDLDTKVISDYSTSKFPSSKGSRLDFKIEEMIFQTNLFVDL